MSDSLKSRLFKRLGRGYAGRMGRGIALRLVADFVSVNAALFLAFTVWFLFYTVIKRTPQSGRLAEDFRSAALAYWPLWSLVALLVFHLNGFYTRTRGYAGRYKALVVFRAVTLFVVVFVFVDYFIFRDALLPRGVAFLSWAFVLLSVGGSRYAKMTVLKDYATRPRTASSRIDRVLVVGGAGYIGSILTAMLLRKGFHVRVLDSLLFSDDALNVVKGHPNFELMHGDVRDIQSVVEAVAECQAVVHLAAIVGDPACEVDRRLSIEINRAATRILIDVARGYDVERFLFASTCSVYGASEFLMDEHSKLNPLSTYARTKADSEQILLEAKSAGFRPTILRLGTVFGLSPRPRFDLVVNLLAARAATLGKITIFNGEQWRPFLHVRDAARAFAMCLEANADVVSGQIFNVGDYALNHKLSEIGDLVARMSPNLVIERIENEDRRNYRVSFDKIHTLLGFRCQTTLEEGIREIYDTVHSAKIADFTASQFNNQAVVRTFAATNTADRSSLRTLQALAEPDPAA
jgi:nucleoside-diphosphate-sugar epimerase